MERYDVVCDVAKKRRSSATRILKDGSRDGALKRWDFPDDVSFGKGRTRNLSLS